MNMAQRTKYISFSIQYMERDYVHWNVKCRNSQYESMFDIQMVNWKINAQKLPMTKSTEHFYAVHIHRSAMYS